MSLNINNLDITGKNIVIIEDDIPCITYYKTLLKNSGANILILHTGKEFVDFLDQNQDPIDLVFMDFLIPQINGIDCTRIFRKEQKKTPVIMITAYSSEHAKTEAYIAGCNEYVLKPIYPEKIFFLIEKYLRTEVQAATTF